jgi:DegV family protein with EDD domain
MQIVTDSGCDLPENFLTENPFVHCVPLTLTLDGKTYREGENLDKDEFYDLLETSGGLPTTSQPSTGEFSDIYENLAKQDDEILSIHISSGLSGTLNSARLAAENFRAAKITLFDTKTLSAAAGWQVQAAVKAIKAGCSIDQILEQLNRIREATDSIYTLKELKYLINGGRISHMKGLIASMLNIKPIIGVEKLKGTYVQLGQARTFQNAIKSITDILGKFHLPGSSLRVQVMHANNPEGADLLKSQIDSVFNCNWLPTGKLSLVLGAHTGPSLVAAACAPEAVCAD